MVLATAAVIVAVRFVATATVLTVNVAVVLPDATLTVAGTTADLELLDSFTNMPPEGAGPVSVTEPIDGEPPATGFGLRFTDPTPGGVTVSEAVTMTLPAVAVIVANLCEVTGLVVTVNAASLWPAKTATEPGTDTVELLLPRKTTNPPDGELPLRLTTPVELLPPAKVAGLRLTSARAAGATVSVAL